jgi:hypothetical protein
MQQALLYLIYFMVGGLGTLAIAILNTTGKSGLGALVGTLPIHFLTNVLIAALIAGPAVAIGFSRTSVITNFAWVGAVLVFAFGLQYTNSLLVATLLCIASSLVFTFLMNEVYGFV